MRLTLAALLVTLGTSVGQASADLWTFVVDAAASTVTIHVGKAGVLGFAGHIHDVVAPAVRGTVTTSPDGRAPFNVSLSFDGAALRVVDKNEAASVVDEIQRVMLGPGVLDVKKYPTIAYKFRTITRADPADGNGYTFQGFEGELTLHGVSRPVSGTVHCSASGAWNTLTARGTVTIKQSDFGITPVTAAGGTIRVRNEVDVSFEIAARRSTVDGVASKKSPTVGF